MAQQLRALATLPAPTCSSQLSVTQVPVDHTDIHVGQTPNICIYVCMYVCVYIYKKFAWLPGFSVVQRLREEECHMFKANLS